MSVVIGIRREDKNEWERRVPLTPNDLANLKKDNDIEFVVQPSDIRVFTNGDYQEAGITVAEDLSEAQVVLGVKEMPISMLTGPRAFVYFSHTVKGQDYNMPMLQHLLDQGATLIDYEKIADEQNRRLIFFSLHAGYAGMIESLVGLGQRYAWLGHKTPLLDIKHAYEYPSLEAAKTHITEIGQRISNEGLGERHLPIIIGVAGYGNVAKGCQDILDCLPVNRIAVDELAKAAESTVDEVGPLVVVEFKEEDMVRPKAAEAHFVLQDYYQRPENYKGIMAEHLPHLDVLMNTIYWNTQYPKLVTTDWVKSNYAKDNQPRLQVIGDISCDIEGGIEVTMKAPQPNNPCFVYEAQTGKVLDGVEGQGPVVMSVDNLPCELPRESSEHFSTVLRDMVPALAKMDLQVDFDSLNLPPHLKKAVITHQGNLTPDYQYLQKYLD